MGTTAGAAGPAEAGAAATRVREDGERRALTTRRPSRGRAAAASARHPAAQPRPGRRRLMDAMTASACHPAAQPRPWGRRKMDAMTASARRPAAQPGPGRRLQIDAMTASAPHLAAQPGPERRRWRCAMTASAAQCPGSWSRKGRTSRTESQMQWGAGWPADSTKIQFVSNTSLCQTSSPTADALHSLFHHHLGSRYVARKQAEDAVRLVRPVDQLSLLRSHSGFSCPAAGNHLHLRGGASAGAAAHRPSSHCVHCQHQPRPARGAVVLCYVSLQAKLATMRLGWWQR